MNVEHENRRRLVAFFRSGAKGDGEMRTTLGVEVEHFVVADDGSPISYEPRRPYPGISEVLDYLKGFYPHEIFGSRRDLIGLFGEEGSVTLEPAAQLEVSAAPCTQVDEFAVLYRRFRERVDAFLATRGAHIEAWGYHPTRHAQELTLIPKRRYDFMDAYFAQIASHGDRMMRASASTQVSVDYASEEDAVRKMRVASALAPILAAITDNTPVFEAEPNHVPIRRLKLWREVDGLRCGTIPSVFEEGFGFDAYARWLLATPPIFVTRRAAGVSEGPTLRPFFIQQASEAYADAPMTGADIEHLISMFWPDVRLKRFVEIRPADSLPEREVLGYAALIKGIFYGTGALRAIEEELGVASDAAQTRGAWPLDVGDVERAIDSIQGAGLASSCYGIPLRTWERTLFDLARAELKGAERDLLDPLEEFAQNKPFYVA